MSRANLTAEWILRTLWRAGQLADMVHPETLARWLTENRLTEKEPPADIQNLRDYFEACWYYMEKLRPRSQLRFAMCGGYPERLDGDDMRTDARYCSAKCRRRAYRKRVAANSRTNTASVTNTQDHDASQAPWQDNHHGDEARPAP